MHISLQSAILFLGPLLWQNMQGYQELSSSTFVTALSILTRMRAHIELSPRRDNLKYICVLPFYPTLHSYWKEGVAMCAMVKGMFANTGLTSHIIIWTSFKGQEIQSPQCYRHARTYSLRVNWWMSSGELGPSYFALCIYLFFWQRGLRHLYKTEKLTKKLYFKKTFTLLKTSESFVLFNVHNTCSQPLTHQDVHPRTVRSIQRRRFILAATDFWGRQGR